jgi:hypothetical protein
MEGSGLGTLLVRTTADHQSQLVGPVGEEFGRGQVLDTSSGITARDRNGFRADVPLHRRGALWLWFAASLSIAGLITHFAIHETPIVWVDIIVHRLDLKYRFPEFTLLARSLEAFGQRGPTAFGAIVVTIVMCRRLRNWQPLVILMIALLGLNFLVGITKLWSGRGKPYFDDIGFFEPNGAGMMYPSGHAGNVIVTWGLLFYLLAVYYGFNHRFHVRVMTWFVGVASVVMGLGSLFLDFHWVTDLLTGWAVGGAVLSASIIVDSWLRAHGSLPVVFATTQAVVKTLWMRYGSPVSARMSNERPPERVFSSRGNDPTGDRREHGGDLHER